jgi:hypothetical protein
MATSMVLVTWHCDLKHQEKYVIYWAFERLAVVIAGGVGSSDLAPHLLLQAFLIHLGELRRQIIAVEVGVAEDSVGSMRYDLNTSDAGVYAEAGAAKQS